MDIDDGDPPHNVQEAGPSMPLSTENTDPVDDVEMEVLSHDSKGKKRSREGDPEKVVGAPVRKVVVQSENQLAGKYGKVVKELLGTRKKNKELEEVLATLRSEQELWEGESMGYQHQINSLIRKNADLLYSNGQDTTSRDAEQIERKDNSTNTEPLSQDVEQTERKDNSTNTAPLSQDAEKIERKDVSTNTGPLSEVLVNDEQVTKLQSDFNTQSTQFEVVKKDLSERDAKINALQSQLEASKEQCAKFDDLKTQLDSCKNDLTRAGEQLQEAETQKAESKNELARKMTELQTMRLSFEKQNSELNELREKETLAKEEVQALTITVVNCKAERDDAKQQLYNEQYQHMMNEAESADVIDDLE
ncbi:hypothetical protein F5878DRAFT_667841, partial [Lentinula raphanica]